ncbi:hypothetical protein CRG98_030484 [Punica granatum]|uniref:Retrotransposon Copia-like N-terminal domain-containing protein n=1 Tax=Punica granatum TaxID=22663 RepID=A0A2I0IYQ3_PUNGR|nr:hypothetical protein CRG98_030484 [Punica granatum]
MSNTGDLEKEPNKGYELGQNGERKEELPPVYQLGTADGTGAVLISCTLKGDNYLTWSRAMLTALREKSKRPFITRTQVKPKEDDPLKESWEVRNSTIITWIFNTNGCGYSCNDCWSSRREASLGRSQGKAANYLNIKGLLDLTCQTVVDMIKGKTPEEIRKAFNIKNNFTPEEEEERTKRSRRELARGSNWEKRIARETVWAAKGTTTLDILNKIQMGGPFVNIVIKWVLGIASAGLSMDTHQIGATSPMVEQAVVKANDSMERAVEA